MTVRTFFELLGAGQARIIELVSFSLDLRLVKGVKGRERFNNGCDTPTIIQSSLKVSGSTKSLAFHPDHGLKFLGPFRPKILTIVGVPTTNGNLCHYEIRFRLPKGG